MYFFFYDDIANFFFLLTHGICSTGDTFILIEVIRKSIDSILEGVCSNRYKYAVWSFAVEEEKNYFYIYLKTSDLLIKNKIIQLSELIPNI